ncbi:hypothetical protein [Dulcicalothrix desertica]|uniref:hypothetical protein n=1 Tax=Dulcicalothrix desertica TaxID=32056 RepID=UPI000F8E08EE|nr:hypothetical protein [Dulcicalothrix desertica]
MKFRENLEDATLRENCVLRTERMTEVPILPIRSIYINARRDFTCNVSTRVCLCVSCVCLLEAP